MIIVTSCNYLTNNRTLVGLVPSRYNNHIQIQLTKIGQIIDKHWYDIPNQYDNIEIDEFIIMPNHIHGIIIIDN